MPRLHRAVVFVAPVLVLVVLGHAAIARRFRAVELLRSLASAQSSEVLLVESELALPGRSGPIRARLYRRADAPRGPGLVVAHGVHWQGIDERRLVPFARSLARAGRVVLTPELDELADYRITSGGVDVIADAARWLSAQANVVSEPRVGLLGFSFAGGLALVAAKRPEAQGRLSYVTSVGGHHDLGRVIRFLLTDEIPTPTGRVREKAHEYGLVVLVYGHLERFVDEPDRPALREALRQWLHEDRRAAWAAASRRETASGERLFQLLVSGRLRELRPELEALTTERAAELRALSPSGALGDLGVPVYLLHGSGDTVIPPSETAWADFELARAPHRALVSPLLEHVEVTRSTAFAESVKLVEFMAELL